MQILREKLALLKMPSDERKHYEDYIQDMVVERNVIETAWKEGENQAKLAIAHKMLESVWI